MPTLFSAYRATDKNFYSYFSMVLSEQKFLKLNFQKVQEGIQILNIPK